MASGNEQRSCRRIARDGYSGGFGGDGEGSMAVATALVVKVTAMEAALSATEVLQATGVAQGRPLSSAPPTLTLSVCVSAAWLQIHRSLQSHYIVCRPLAATRHSHEHWSPSSVTVTSSAVIPLPSCSTSSLSGIHVHSAQPTAAVCDQVGCVGHCWKVEHTIGPVIRGTN